MLNTLTSLLIGAAENVNDDSAIDGFLLVNVSADGHNATKSDEDWVLIDMQDNDTLCGEDPEGLDSGLLDELELAVSRNSFVESHSSAAATQPLRNSRLHSNRSDSLDRIVAGNDLLADVDDDAESQALVEEYRARTPARPQLREFLIAAEECRHRMLIETRRQQSVESRERAKRLTAGRAELQRINAASKDGTKHKQSRKKKIKLYGSSGRNIDRKCQ